MKIAIPIMASQFLLRAGDFVGLFVLEIFDPNENEVGYLAAARQTSELLNIAYAAMLVLVMPQLGAIASDHGTEQERQRLFGQSTAIVFSLTTICALPMILAPQPVMAIFGRNFAEGAAYLVPLALGALLIGGFGIGNSFLTFLGHGKALVRLLIWVVIIIIPVTMVLTRTFGGLGTAYSKLIYAIILTVGVLFLLWRRERLLPFRS